MRTCFIFLFQYFKPQHLLDFKQTYANPPPLSVSTVSALSSLTGHPNLGSNLFLFSPVQWCCEMVPQVNVFLLLDHHLGSAVGSICIRLNALKNTSNR